MTALYNEIEPYPAQWLRNLSDAGHIAQGTVDARSIRDLRADDVVAATQFHTFAGLGAWSYALRLAGWADDRPVWTGSCPCQPFSVAGKGKGADDERHLWPEFFRLIRECRPVALFGEQVASPDGIAWLDAVHADMEGAGYTVGAAVLPAAGVGAPHLRHRIFFGAYRVADAGTERRLEHGERDSRALAGEQASRGGDVGGRGSDARGFVADPRSEGRRQVGSFTQGSGSGSSTEGLGERPVHSGALGLADTLRHGWQQDGRDAAGSAPAHPRWAADWDGDDGPHGAWADVAWLPCRDGKSRPAQSGTFPLAHGAPARVGRLRAYGNAIVPQVAATFIRAFMDVMPCPTT